MARLSAVLDTELNTFLEKEAEKVANFFSKKYRNWRNPEGKESILVYGGHLYLRSEFTNKIYQKLPLGMNAFVLERDKKIGLREGDENPRILYVDFNTVLKTANIHH